MFSLAFPVPRETAACAHSVVPTNMKVGDCVSTAMVNMTQCVGTCGSNATTVFMEPFVETNCKCCKPTSMTKQTVNLQCGEYLSYCVVTVTSYTRNDLEIMTESQLKITAAWAFSCCSLRVD